MVAVTVAQVTETVVWSAGRHALTAPGTVSTGVSVDRRKSHLFLLVSKDFYKVEGKNPVTVDEYQKTCPNVRW